MQDSAGCAVLHARKIHYENGQYLGLSEQLGIVLSNFLNSAFIWLLKVEVTCVTSL